MAPEDEDAPRFFVASLSHRTAPVEVREQVAVPADERVARAEAVMAAAGLEEVVLLSTCNRVEVYGVAPANRPVDASVFAALCPEVEDVAAHVVFLEGDEAMRHLFEVAGGLHSMVLGETEITGQLKQAYLAAQSAGLTGRVTNPIFQLALRTAKAIRTKTNIGRGATSVGSVAVEVAEKIFAKGLTEASVLILGAGQMGETCVRHLKKHGARRVTVCNRSPEKARKLAAEVGGEAVAWEARREAIAASDIIVGAAGCAEYLITAADLEALRAGRRERPFFLIDIAVPRIFDPALAPREGVFLYDIDDLTRVVAEHRGQREQAVADARAIVAEAVAEGRRRLRPRVRGAQAGARPARADGKGQGPQEFDGGRTGWPLPSNVPTAIPAGAL